METSQVLLRLASMMTRMTGTDMTCKKPWIDSMTAWLSIPKLNDVNATSVVSYKWITTNVPVPGTSATSQVPLMADLAYIKDLNFKLIFSTSRRRLLCCITGINHYHFIIPNKFALLSVYSLSEFFIAHNFWSRHTLRIRPSWPSTRKVLDIDTARSTCDTKERSC